MIENIKTASEPQDGCKRSGAGDETASSSGRLALGGSVVVGGEVGVMVCVNFGTAVIRLPGERYVQMNMMQFAGELGLLEHRRCDDHGHRAGEGEACAARRTSAFDRPVEQAMCPAEALS